MKHEREEQLWQALEATLLRVLALVQLEEVHCSSFFSNSVLFLFHSSATSVSLGSSSVSVFCLFFEHPTHVSLLESLSPWVPVYHKSFLSFLMPLFSFSLGIFFLFLFFSHNTPVSQPVLPLLAARIVSSAFHHSCKKWLIYVSKGLWHCLLIIECNKIIYNK